MSKTKKVRKPQPFNISNAGEIHFTIYFILKLDYHYPISTPTFVFEENYRRKPRSFSILLEVRKTTMEENMTYDNNFCDVIQE